MMILLGVVALGAVCLVRRSSQRGANRLDRTHLHSYEHRSRCEEILPLDYLSR